MRTLGWLALIFLLLDFVPVVAYVIFLVIRNGIRARRDRRETQVEPLSIDALLLKQPDHSIPHINDYVRIRKGGA